MTTLIQYGWSNFQDEQYNLFLNKELLPGRVTTVRGFKYILMTESGELETELSGKLLYGTETDDLPKVGDWALYLDYGATGYITDVLPRLNALMRKEPGTKTGRQVLGCNIDYALIIQGLDRDFNLMRLDRYIVQITACGIKPVVILNKSDLPANPGEFVNEVMGLKRDCPVHLCSTFTGAGISEIQSQILQKQKTFILLGSSGVGKSSLLNALMNADVQRTGEVSDFNQKGKHTTSTRDLFLLNNGSLIIDSPGMREFGLTSAEAHTSAELFPEISKFSGRCRFNNCTHQSEAGCGVIAGVHSGELDETIYASYLKLMKEQKHFAQTASDKKRLGKQTGKMIREVKDFKKRFKGG
ncbi:MAG: ribosome small subunit-dependent GTPase A [Cyclobacteriaceae bacterium]